MVTAAGLRKVSFEVGDNIDRNPIHIMESLNLAADRIEELEEQLAQTRAGADQNGAIADLALCMANAPPAEEEKFCGYTLLEAAGIAVSTGTLGAWEWFQAWFNAGLTEDDPPPGEW
jgi:hypothetical protein